MENITKLIEFIKGHGQFAMAHHGKIVATTAAWCPATGTWSEETETLDPTWAAVRAWLGY